MAFNSNWRIRASLLLLGLTTASFLGPVGPAVGAGTTAKAAIETLTKQIIADRQDGGLVFDQKAAKCIATRIVTAIGAKRALYLTSDPSLNDKASELSAKEKTTYFSALVACIPNLDQQLAAFLAQARPELTPAKLRCAAVQYRNNGGLKEATLSDGSDASNARIDAALASASKACKISPPIAVG